MPVEQLEHKFLNDITITVITIVDRIVLRSTTTAVVADYVYAVLSDKLAYIFSSVEQPVKTR